MKLLHITLILLFIISAGFKTGKPAWILYSKDGKPVKYKKMVRKIQDADIILFGEHHNNPVSHWLQLELSKDLFRIKGRNLVLGAEMFENDNQLILDEYLEGLISQSHFEAAVKLWPNYRSDYKPLVELARVNQLRFIATNIPRRYASIVNSDGFAGLEMLSEQAKTFLPPLPVEYNPDLKAYSSMLEMEGIKNHINENFPKAQAIKDATMSHIIIENWSPEKLFLHFNGAYHSDNYESIYWYLKQKNPELRIATLTTVTQKDISSLNEENTGKADYIICVDENLASSR